MAELLLGVNIDHIATLRNARGTAYPDPVQAAFIAEQAGADGQADALGKGDGSARRVRQGAAGHERSL